MATPKELFAYADTFAGIIPCKVVGTCSFKFGDRGISQPNVICEVTAARPGYPRGERFKMHPSYVWPRNVAFRKRGSYGQKWIVGPYNWWHRLEMQKANS